jgi:Family of unknown function (DUF6345)
MTATQASVLGTNPFGNGEAAAAPRGGEHVFGALSIEQFVNQNPLGLTHEDAEGWLNYLRQFATENFHFRDGGVQVWAYEEDFDNYQDTYGMDSVVAVYHSGHGGMDGNGVFFAPLGAAWDNRSDALSTNMRLGNEFVNYVFWSTCTSCRVKDGHDPVRTWHNANLGFRMLFGFETVSVDHAGYGQFFWEEYNRPKSFARAWLDASWRISQSQEPSVVAAGANGQEALARLENERTLEWAHVSRDWYQWWWYDMVRAGADPQGMAPRSVELPGELLVAEFTPPARSLEEARDLAGQHGLDLPDPAAMRAGLFVSESDGQALTLFPDGRYEVSIEAPNTSNSEGLPIDDAKRRATDLVSEHGLDQGIDLEFDRVRHTMSAGAPTAGGEGDEPHVLETTVQFRQLINGMPVVTQASGDVRITLDNDGRLTRIENTTRKVDQLSDHPKATIPEPGGETQGIRARGGGDPERLLAEAWGAHRAPAAREQETAEQAVPVPDTTEVGYDVRGNEGRLVARREVEVEFGEGIRKRYEVIAPIVE